MDGSVKHKRRRKRDTIKEYITIKSGDEEIEILLNQKWTRLKKKSDIAKIDKDTFAKYASINDADGIRELIAKSMPMKLNKKWVRLKRKSDSVKIDEVTFAKYVSINDADGIRELIANRKIEILEQYDLEALAKTIKLDGKWVKLKEECEKLGIDEITFTEYALFKDEGGLRAFIDNIVNESMEETFKN